MFCAEFVFYMFWNIRICYTVASSYRTVAGFNDICFITEADTSQTSLLKARVGMEDLVEWVVGVAGGSLRGGALLGEGAVH